MADMLVVKSKVKAYAKENGKAFGGAAAEKLSERVAQLVDDAIERADANGRKTVKARDI